MIKNASELGEQNKVVPVWLRTVFLLPGLVATVWLIIYWDGVYGHVADIQISWFDGYYIVLTGLITLLVYLTILIVCLIPGLLLTNFSRRFFTKNESQSNESMSNRSSYH